MRRGLFALHCLTIALAAAAATLPLPPRIVERYYSDWYYPALQARLTSWSNETGVALFDFIVVMLMAAVIVLLWRTVAAAVRERSVRRLLRGALTVTTLLASVYLWFSLAWGLNYSREPLEEAVGYDAKRVTADAVRALANRAVDEANQSYAAGHASGFPSVGEMPPSLVTSMHVVERRLGRARPTTPGRPKRTLLSTYFRASGVDGMHAPFMLETLINPDLTPPERPAVLAHEWAHLAGYAPEDDASFVGLLAALGADPGARYSAWLTLVFEASNQLPRQERDRVLARLAEGPKQDTRAIVERMKSRVPVVQEASWRAYDQYLKSQGIPEGILNYSRIVQLLIGSGAIDW